VQVWVLEQRALIEAERPDGVARAVQLATIGLSLLRAHGEDLLTTILLGNLSEFANQEGRADDAAHLAEEGIMTIRGLGLDDEVLSPLLGQRGYARLLLGDSEDAVRDLRLAFHGDLVRGITVGALYHLVLLAGAAATTWPACAAEYLGVVDAALKTAGTPAQAAVRARYLTQLPDVLGHEAYQRAHEEGSRLVAELGVTAALQVIDRDLVRRHAGG